MTVKIFGKHTGLGNQIQFIPFIRKLQNADIFVYSDSPVYDQLDICPTDLSINKYKFDKGVVIYGYDWKKLLFHTPWLWKKLYGFQYRIKGKYYSFGYKDAIRFDKYMKMHEMENNSRLCKYLFGFKVPLEYPKMKRTPNNKIILDVNLSESKGLFEAEWMQLFDLLSAEGYEVICINNRINRDFTETPSIKALAKTLSGAKLMVCCDNGVMHLADYLGVPTIVLFGPTSYLKNHPVNGVSLFNGYCQSCYNYGRIKCNKTPLYKCMRFDVEYLATKIKQYYENL